MTFFPLLDFQHLVLAFFMGLMALLLIALAFGSHAGRPTESPAEIPHARDELTILLGRDEEKNPAVPILILIYAGVILFAAIYWIVIGIRGGAF